MSKVLYIEASPRGDDAGSTRLVSWFADSCGKANPDAAIAILSVFEADLPIFGADAANAKFAPMFGEEVSAAHTASWGRRSEDFAARKVLAGDRATRRPQVHYSAALGEPIAATIKRAGPGKQQDSS